jgi:hypothetical protein
MAGKRKKKKAFRAVEAVKALARERIGAPPPEQVVPNKRKKKEGKHKATLQQILDDSLA